jgi:tripartite-type tricarboxylate transporter receptor subunit TctC
MQISRRNVLSIGSAAAVASTFPGGVVLAQAYPSQDLHMINGFPPGSGADVLTRYFAEKVRPLANRPVIVENKVGASGAMAVQYSAQAKPDGHTMYLSAASATAAQMHLYKNPPVQVIKAFQIAATINRQAFMLAVDVNSPYKTVAELTEAMIKKGDKASYATAATSGIVMGAMYVAKTGIKAVEVRYKDSAGSLNDIASGRIDFTMVDPVFGLAQQREGRLRILAHSAGKRLEAVPELPTMAESGVPEMDLVSWWAVHVPTETPKPIVDQINAWFKQILSTDETKAFLNKFGGDPFISTPEEAQALFVKEDKAWAEYVRIAKIEPQG